MDCRRCTLKSLEVLTMYTLFEDLSKYYSKAGLTDYSHGQIDNLKKELSERLGNTITSCELPQDSPIVKVKQDLDRATNVQGMLWAVQDFEGALHQSLRM